MADIIRWAVFASGNGSNLQNFIDLEKTDLERNRLHWVHCNRDCKAMERARRAGKPVGLLDSKSDRYEENLLSMLEEFQIDRIFLMGYMKILSGSFLKQWAKPVINLHPSLLPDFKGSKAMERVFDSGQTHVGVSLHEVVEELDSGPILLQKDWSRPAELSFEAFQQKMHELEREIVREYFFDLESKSEASLS